jgi:hypothetical protein
MKIITLQPAPHVDNMWAGPDGSLVEGTQLPYPFVVNENGDVLGQEFWRGDPKAVVGFQDDVAVQKVNLWWRDVVADPQLAVGKYPVMVQDTENSKGTHMYTYVIAIESVEVREVPEEES